MIYLLITLQLLDLYTTHRALSSGTGQEGNGVLRALFERFGHLRVLLVIKGAFIVWLWFVAPVLEANGYGWVLVAIAALYVWIVFNNWQVINRSKEH